MVRSEAKPVVERIQSNLYCHLHDNSLPCVSLLYIVARCKPVSRGLMNAAVVILAMVLLIPLEGARLSIYMSPEVFAY